MSFSNKMLRGLARLLWLAGSGVLLGTACQMTNTDSASSGPVVDGISQGITAGISILLQAALITLAT